MSHSQCVHSRRGHTWREIGAAPDRTGIIDHARRICAKCGALGHVDKQGRVASGERLAVGSVAPGQ